MKTPSILVASENSLEGSGGGVQQCTTTFVHLITDGFELTRVAFRSDRRLRSRINNRLFGDAYRRHTPVDLSTQIVVAIEKTGSRIVFFNLGDFPREAAHLRNVYGTKIRLIQLSHGLDSTDMLIDQQFRRSEQGTINSDSRAARIIGDKLQYEADYRRHLDACICLSPLDAEIERWLGARRTMVVPKLIREPALSLRPIEGRAGCVATLDHPPNINGLSQLLRALESRVGDELEFRIVGKPRRIGQSLAEHFHFAQYLGALSDGDLREEAATWCCFVNPVFAYARGCSTKIATALGWGLPIVTTCGGARGYVWDETLQPLAESAEALAEMVIHQSKASQALSNAAGTVKLAQLQGSRQNAATAMTTFISSL
jgi:Glycosyl transferases group 1